MCVRAGAEQDRVQPATEGARGVAGQPSLRLQAQGHRQSPEVIPPPPPRPLQTHAVFVLAAFAFRLFPFRFR